MSNFKYLFNFLNLFYSNFSDSYFVLVHDEVKKVIRAQRTNQWGLAALMK